MTSTYVRHAGLADTRTLLAPPRPAGVYPSRGAPTGDESLETAKVVIVFSAPERLPKSEHQSGLRPLSIAAIPPSEPTAVLQRRRRPLLCRVSAHGVSLRRRPPGYEGVVRCPPPNNRHPGTTSSPSTSPAVRPVRITLTHPSLTHPCPIPPTRVDFPIVRLQASPLVLAPAARGRMLHLGEKISSQGGGRGERLG